MGEVVGFPRYRHRDNGTVHVWKLPAGGYEIGQESSSGNSWGSFDQFDTAQEAVAAAYRLNAEEYDGQCEVFVSEDVMADIPITSAPIRGEF